MTDYIGKPLPDPRIVAQAAAEAPAPRVLEDYIEAMQILRAKKFTFREIAKWLEEEFDIEADHNSVWRAYTKAMNDLDAHLEAEADDEIERDEALLKAERNGTLQSVTPAPTDAVVARAESAAEVPKAKKKARKVKRA